MTGGPATAGVGAGAGAGAGADAGAGAGATAIAGCGRVVTCAGTCVAASAARVVVASHVTKMANHPMG
jgi:hypothetical protein